MLFIQSHIAIIALSLLSFSTMAQVWELQETEENSPVLVWTKAIPGSNFKAFRGQVTINDSLKKTLAVIKDTANIPKWYHNTSIAKQIVILDANQSLNYTVTTAPWPVTNRDSVTLVTDKPQASGEYLIELNARPEEYPEQVNRIRIPKLEGFWKLVPLTANKTEVTLQIAAEPGGEIPSWLANSMVIDMPFYSLTNLKKRVENNLD